MALLYADLDPRDSNQIVAKLEASNVKYELRANGTQIYVPSDQALRMRITLAQEGLPRGGSVGYEIFDRSEALGSSSFVQNINRLRALEGELGRTIASMTQVKAARVHIVMPRRQLFSRKRQEPSASIIVRSYRGIRLAPSQVLAIQHLAAAAVPGLKPSRISIVDGRGNLLAKGSKEGNTPQMMAARADEMRLAYENRIARKVEAILAKTLGPGKVRAQVTADMDFDRVTTATEKYDPDGRVVRSTQTIEEKTTAKETEAEKPVSVQGNLPRAGQQAPQAGGSERQTTKTRERTNYEISKVVRNHVRISGVVKRISVAVLVDGTYTKPTGDGAPQYAPRTKEELTQLTALVRSAIGFDQKRGDVVEVVNLKFNAGPIPQGSALEAPAFDLTKHDYMRIAEIAVLAILALLVIMMVIRPLMRKLMEPPAPQADDGTPQLADQSGDQAALPSPDGEEALSVDDMIDIDKVAGRVRAGTVKKIGDIVDKHPDESLSIIRNWMYQET